MNNHNLNIEQSTMENRKHYTYATVIRDLSNMLDGELEGELQKTVKGIIDDEFDDPDQGQHLKRTEKDDWAVIVMIKHNWGKGRTIQEAVKNCPSFDASSDVMLISVFMPSGTTLYNADNHDSAYDAVYIDQMGSINYPWGASYHQQNKEPIQLRKYKTK